MIDDGFGYFSSAYNFIDLCGLFFVLVVLLLTGTGIKLITFEALRIIAALGTCFTFMKLFDWFRLFDETGFYVLLVAETLYDIRYFLLLLITTLMMFGVPLIMLDGNSEEGSELIDGTFNFWLVDLVYNQYMLSLGEFGMDNFDAHPQAVLVYIFFILATFFT